MHKEPSHNTVFTEQYKKFFFTINNFYLKYFGIFYTFVNVSIPSRPITWPW